MPEFGSICLYLIEIILNFVHGTTEVIPTYFQ